MALLVPIILFLPLISLFSGANSFTVSAATIAAERKNYIVHMNAAKKPTTHLTHEDWYRHTLASLSIDPDIHLLYTYSSALHGFSASLLPHHLPLLRRHPALLHLHPDPLLHLHTTRSPLFLGLLPSSPTPLTQAASTANDVIIGVLDTGVWPESPSFSDANLPPIPARWRGECEPGVDFPPSLCNRKLIGARSFERGFHAGAPGATHEYASPRDRDGHGTHTASTAAGAPSANASLLGYAAGTARGMAVNARIAAYKVCWSSGCFGSDILAGMDAALADGVDVLSLSLGGGSTPYFRDTIAVGAFAAAERGVFVSCSAGNSGPRRATLANAAPWIATVGAGTLDRDFPAYAALAGGQREERHTGVSLYSGKGMGSKKVPLLYGPTAGRGGNGTQMCLAGTLDPARVKGKVVLCDRGISARVEKGAVVKAAGGVGMILANTAANGEELVADSHLLPAVAVGSIDGDRIRKYAVRNRKATAALSFGGTVVGVRPSPVVAAFSSRGPNLVTPAILKPDLIGPGINILAGWSGSVGPTGLAMDTRRTEFNIMSGTSMSCPHISGLAALLKAAHPGWSPSAIKSALMTTAYTLDNTGSPLRDAAGGSLATPLAYGAGHVDPEKALSPGLVYDITTDDYITFLCSLNYTMEHIQALAKRPNINCSQRLSNPGDLNYPSFSVMFEKARRIVKYRRELTNVGNAKSVYSLKLGGTENVSVSVKPKKLSFKQVGQKLKYTITFTSKKGVNPTDVQFGWISWSNKENQVRSPIAYTWKMA